MMRMFFIAANYIVAEIALIAIFVLDVNCVINARIAYLVTRVTMPIFLTTVLNQTNYIVKRKIYLDFS